MKYHFIPAVLLVLGSFTLLNAQYTPGQSYFDDSTWVEYIAGDLPIVLISSHGGYLEPNSLPMRMGNGYVTLRDSYTQEITRATADEIFRLTGCYPHVVINLLHRNRLDANREIVEATDSNAVTEPAWHAFHNFGDLASKTVEQDWGKGLVIDVHGHAHTIQRLEMGYLLNDNDIMLPPDSLNVAQRINKSGIKNLIHNNLQGHNHNDLVRGEHALGSLLDTCGFPAIPSYNDPFLNVGDPYFDGGYDVRRYGSRDSGTVDCIQIEGNNAMRFDSIQRNLFADTLAQKLIDFMQIHYWSDFGNACALPNSIEKIESSFCQYKLYPNPSTDKVWFDNGDHNYEISIYTLSGAHLKTMKAADNIIDIAEMAEGIYLVEFRDKKTSNSCVTKLIKN